MGLSGPACLFLLGGCSTPEANIGIGEALVQRIEELVRIDAERKVWLVS